MNTQELEMYEELKRTIMKEILEHAKPSPETLNKINEVWECLNEHIKTQKENEDRREKILKDIVDKLDSVLPMAKEINDWKTALKIGGFLTSSLVKCVIGAGVLIGGFIAIRDYFRK